mmetsp:Transcript_55302/g.131917  ORF Transcript_55302/g.131917 Transcript_55302/m.131917 type:complete len:270 (+) Transcript_55302:104-913(+)
MITFLPLSDFIAIARLLDNKRLVSQRVEARFILRCVRNVDGRYSRFQNAGYVRMWLGYAEALAVYYNAVFDEFVARGFSEGISKRDTSVQGLGQGDVAMPGWLGDERLHSTHRAALLFKDPSHYGTFGWTEQPVVQYLWPRRCQDGSWELIPPATGESQPSAKMRAKLLRRSQRWGREFQIAGASTRRRGRKASPAREIAKQLIDLDGDAGSAAEDALPKLQPSTPLTCSLAGLAQVRKASASLAVSEEKTRKRRFSSLQHGPKDAICL